MPRPSFRKLSKRTSAMNNLNNKQSIPGQNPIRVTETSDHRSIDTIEDRNIQQTDPKNTLFRSKLSWPGRSYNNSMSCSKISFFL